MSQSDQNAYIKALQEYSVLRAVVEGASRSEPTWWSRLTELSHTDLTRRVRFRYTQTFESLLGNVFFRILGCQDFSTYRYILREEVDVSTEGRLLAVVAFVAHILNRWRKVEKHYSEGYMIDALAGPLWSLVRLEYQRRTQAQDLARRRQLEQDQARRELEDRRKWAERELPPRANVTGFPQPLRTRSFPSSLRVCPVTELEEEELANLQQQQGAPSWRPTPAPRRLSSPIRCLTPITEDEEEEGEEVEAEPNPDQRACNSSGDAAVGAGATAAAAVGEDPWVPRPRPLPRVPACSRACSSLIESGLQYHDYTELDPQTGEAREVSIL